MGKRRIRFRTSGKMISRDLARLNQGSCPSSGWRTSPQTALLELESTPTRARRIPTELPPTLGQLRPKCIGTDAKTLVENTFERLVKGRVFTMQQTGPLKKILRYHGEKLRLVSQRIAINVPERLAAIKTIGIDGLLRKPFPLNELTGTVREILDAIAA